MKKFLSLFVLLSVNSLAALAQVFILNDNVFQGRMSEIKTMVLDSLTNEPVAFASVYVIPSKDTTITNFTLTDAEGEAKLDEVPFGSYVFHVEMMGYKPFVRERFFRDSEVDMGTIRMQQDERFLQAAVISDVGNPIVIKQDTVEFNASSFRVGANAMLRDLIQRMPGFYIIICHSTLLQYPFVQNFKNLDRRLRIHLLAFIHQQTPFFSSQPSI